MHNYCCIIAIAIYCRMNSSFWLNSQFTRNGCIQNYKKAPVRYCIQGSLLFAIEVNLFFLEGVCTHRLSLVGNALGFSINNHSVLISRFTIFSHFSLSVSESNLFFFIIYKHIVSSFCVLECKILKKTLERKTKIP